MIEMIIVVVFLLWLFGQVFHFGGDLIHLLWGVIIFCVILWFVRRSRLP